jgi:hypothetical protein
MNLKLSEGIKVQDIYAGFGVEDVFQALPRLVEMTVKHGNDYRVYDENDKKFKTIGMPLLHIGMRMNRPVYASYAGQLYTGCGGSFPSKQLFRMDCIS